MTRATKEPTPKPGIDLLAGIPDPPSELIWNPDGFTDKRGPWCRGLAEVDADGADRSGPDKGLRAVRRLGWSVHLVGGSARNWRQQLAEAMVARETTQLRFSWLERQGRDTTEATGEIAADDRHIERLGSLIEAAAKWEGSDNVDLRQRMEDADRRHQDLAARIEPYRKARLPVPDGLEEALFEAEKAAVGARSAFDAGRGRLDALNEQLRAATEQAYQALAGALAHVEDRLGQKAAEIVNGDDAEFLIRFPNRAPDELLHIHARASRVGAITEQLGSAHNAGMSRFWLACGEVGREVVSGKVGVHVPPFREPGMRRKSSHPDALMNVTF